jgi:hypothetical protein
MYAFHVALLKGNRDGERFEAGGALWQNGIARADLLHFAAVCIAGGTAQK